MNQPGTNPSISIVLPVYNGERYLSEAIESCLNQTLPDFELIIVDDKSSDSSLEIMCRYAAKDRRIHVVQNQENMRLPASLNIGFERARGRLFTWTSDDNILDKSFLQTLVTEMEKSGSDIVYSNYFLINERAEDLGLAQAVRVEDFPVRTGIGASFLYKRKVHETLQGFDTSLFLLEDYDFWIRAYMKGFSFKHLNTAPYYYRIHSASLSSVRKRTIKIKTVEYRYNLRTKIKPHQAILFRLGLLKQGVTILTTRQRLNVVREIISEISQIVRGKRSAYPLG